MAESGCCMRPLLPAIALASIVWGQVPPSRQPRLLVLAHVNIVDVTTGLVRRDYDVSIARDRIAALKASTPLRASADVRVIDARGKYLIPGLVDMHVHASDERFLNLFVANGVTSVRLMWGAGSPELAEANRWWRTARPSPLDCEPARGRSQADVARLDGGGRRAPRERHGRPDRTRRLRFRESLQSAAARGLLRPAR
jgi:hypothetical protein